MIAHDPDRCRCDDYDIERALPGSEPEPKRRHPAWLLVDFAMLAIVGVLLSYIYLESVQ